MNLTWKSGLGIKPSGFLLLGGGALACGAIWLVGLNPLQAQVDDGAREVTAVQAQVTQTRQLLDQAQAGGAAYLSQLEQAALYADELLPSQFDPVELLNIIPPSASTFGVRAVLSQDNPDAGGQPSPGASAPADSSSPATGPLQRIQTRVEATGPITSILEWVNSLRTLSPIMTVDSVAIAGIDGETAATVQLSVWYSTAPPLVPGAPGADTGITPLPSGGPAPDGEVEVEIAPLPEGPTPAPTGAPGP